MAHLSAWPQPGGGHLSHIPLGPPYRDIWTRSGSRPILRSFSELQEGARTGPKMSRRMDPKGTKNGLPKGAQRGLSKTDFKWLLSETLCNIAWPLIVSRCIASRRASFDQDHKAFKKQRQGRPEYFLQRSLPPEKLPLHSLRYSFVLNE